MSARLGDTLTSTDEGTTSEPSTPRPQLFLILECESPLSPSARISLADVDSLSIGRGVERSVERRVEDASFVRELRVADRHMSATHARLYKSRGGWMVRDEGSKNGTSVNGQRVHDAVALTDGDVVEAGRTVFLFRSGTPTRRDDPPVIDATELAPPTPELATFVPELARDLTALGRVAVAQVSLLVYGETGTGKEVVARGLHALSGREPFVPVNCGALPDSLLESQLFGHVKGSFSGAVGDQPGLIRSADRGTLFLDEIAELPLASQAAFLRALQEREVVPVGGTRPIPVDVRLIAATNRDLDSRVAAGEFRADLLARLRGVTLRLWPLRERREDLGLLIAALLPRVTRDASTVSFSVDVVRQLIAYEWPENIRELEKCLEAAVVLAGDAPIGMEHLPEHVRLTTNTPAAAAPSLGSADLERRRQIIALLEEHRGSVSAVARAMGKGRTQIQRWMKRLDIDAAPYRKR